MPARANLSGCLKSCCLSMEPLFGEAACFSWRESSHILDFYCAAAKLAIEVDGGQHYSAGGASKDEARTRFLEARGIRVLRFTNTDVLTAISAVSEAIHAALTTD